MIKSCEGIDLLASSFRSLLNFYYSSFRLSAIVRNGDEGLRTKARADGGVLCFWRYGDTFSLIMEMGRARIGSYTFSSFYLTVLRSPSVFELVGRDMRPPPIAKLETTLLARGFGDTTAS